MFDIDKLTQNKAVTRRASVKNATSNVGPTIFALPESSIPLKKSVPAKKIETKTGKKVKVCILNTPGNLLRTTPGDFLHATVDDVPLTPR